MLEGRDLLIFSGDWNRFPGVLQHLAKHLLPGNRILWIGSVSIRRPRLQLYDFRRVTGRLIEHFSMTNESGDGSRPTAVVHPFVIPLYDVPAVRSINNTLVGSTLRRHIKQLGFRDIVALPSTPMVVDVMQTLGESSIHYICVDDYAQYAGAYKCVRSLEEKMLEKADSCFSLSDALMNSRKVRSGENHFLPMGVDVELFAPSDGPLPAELKSIKRPIAGFFGQIASYVDLDLLVRCAKAYPEISFVVIGRPLVDVTILKQASNIIFLGEIPYAQLPAYARAFDVGLNPRIVNQLTIAMNPLKLMEYMALGMPIVSTDLPEVRKFSDHVSIAENREHFIELVGLAVKDNDPMKRNARRTVAEGFSWSAIVRRVSDSIQRIDESKRRAKT